jgi:hypothetical protein
MAISSRDGRDSRLSGELCIDAKRRSASEMTNLSKAAPLSIATLIASLHAYLKG